ncbi:helicase-related protein [Pararhodospirillum oryzae]|uniref:Helicase n=1 Tax=Pararhodospirillum oryzae TaxID=478448 RepID=A0A512H4V5_9PROT|nr:helicase-related protein [Pararhodospirillum oryzae]GEO80410.1 helicase [Pararhodospirillum oryzae]
MTDPGTPARITAVLGPTNTGKTHLAMERMLGHASGMIGFPLRLLARENYDKAVRRMGATRVALVTGEEKIIPPRPLYYVCTVESMPVDRPVEFLAIDEIQLCGDPDRGHLFTDRLLHARGRVETMFLGAETMAPLIRRLVPGCTFDTRERFSRLTCSGHGRLTRLPRRSAVVAFSADDVYAIAELTRRQRGGAAVVMGALSPRTRNAQVALYQSGEVDYLVATDAIGMGLNMDIDHVAFAALDKFDGTWQRALTPQEVAQIAGRAGRHRNDGTFGTTADARALSEDMIARIEAHSFPAQRTIFWRNSALDFRSVRGLLSSLAAPPPAEGLIRARSVGDQEALEALTRDPEILGAASGVDRVALLWDVCRVPDFRKLQAENHVRLLGQIYRHLVGAKRVLPDDFVAGHVRRLDRADGDIHALVDRIAAIRVWTYVSHQAGWTTDPGHWQGITRAIEDRLSDALHDRLTQRFVDRRAVILLRRLGERAMLEAEVAATDGRVLVEGQDVGRLVGLTFHPEQTGEREGDRAVLNAAHQALRREIGERVARLAADGDDAFSLDANGRLLWHGDPIARLEKGPHPLRPGVTRPSNPFLDEAQLDTVALRLKTWLDGQLQLRLKPLMDLETAPLQGAARGLAYQVAENLGTLPRTGGADQIDQQVRALGDVDRKALARAGVRLGVECLFMPELLKPEPQRLLAVLWRLFHGRSGGEVPTDGRVSFPADKRVPHAFYLAIGYRVIGAKALRVDMVERFAADIRRLVREGLRKPETTPAEGADASGGEEAQADASLSEIVTTEVPLEDAPAPEAPVPETADDEAPAAVEETPEVPQEAPEGEAVEAEAATEETPEPAEAADTAEGTGDGETEDAEARPAREPRVIPEARPGEVRLPPEVLPQLGIGLDEGAQVLLALGYRARQDEGAVFLRPGRRKPAGAPPGRGRGRGRGRADAAPGTGAPEGTAEGEGAGRGGPRGGRGPGRDRRPDERGERGERGARGDRPDRGERGERPDRGERGERPDRGDRRGGKGQGPRRGPGEGRAPSSQTIDPDSPFAILGTLLKR